MGKKGIKKSVIFLSILSSNEREKVFEYLNIKEKKMLIDYSYKNGGWEFIKDKISLKTLNVVVNEMNNFRLKNKYINFSFELLYILTVFPLFFYFAILKNKVHLNLDMIAYAILLPFITFIFKTGTHFNFKTDFTNKQNFVLHFIIGIAGGVILYIILLLLNINTIAQKNVISILTILIFVFIIPFFEEMIFRYLVIKIILKKYSSVIKLFISSLIFALAHYNYVDIEIYKIGFMYIKTVILYFFAGIVLSLIYIEEKYVFPSFLAHSIANFLILFF